VRGGAGFLPEFAAKTERVAEPYGTLDEQLPSSRFQLIEGLAKAHLANGPGASELVGDVEEGVGVLDAAIELEIARGFGAAPDLLGAAGHMIVVMALMKERANPRSVNDREILQAHGFDKPMVKPEAADCEIRNRGIHALGKNEYIDAGVVFVHAVGFGAKLEGIFPAGEESQSLGDIKIDTLGNNQGLGKRLLDEVHGTEKIAEENNIGVDVAESRKTPGGFGFAEKIVEEGSAEFVGGNIGDMLEIQFPRHFGNALVAAEENDFRAGLELGPAANGVALNNADVAFEGLGNGEECQHSFYRIEKTPGNRAAVRKYPYMLLLSALEIFLTWTVFALALIGMGSIVLARFSKDCSVRDAFWMGLAFSVALLEVWNLLLPITAWTTILLLFFGSLGLLANRSVLFSHIKLTLLTSRSIFFLGVAFAFFLSVRSCGPCEYSDTGLYGAPAVRWMQTYPAVPGLANLNGRLGINSSVFLCIAALGQGVWKDLGFHLFTGFLLAALWATLLPACARCVRGTAASPADWFHGILAVPALFWTTRSRIVGTQTDEPATVVALIAAGLLFADLCENYREDQRAPQPARLVLAATLFSLAVAFKESTAVFALLAWCVVFRRIWQTSVSSQLRRFHLAAALVFSSVLLVPWLARSIILSGYPLFPATIFAFSVPWKTPLRAARWYALAVHSWGRGPDAHFVDTQGIQWLGIWSHQALRNRPSFQVPLAISVGGLAVALLTLRFRGGKPRPDCRWLWLLLPSLGGIVFWFITSPDLRFAQFAIWTVAASLSTWGIVCLDLDRSRPSARLVSAALVLSTIWCLISVGWKEPIQALRGVHQPPPLPKPALTVKRTISGLAVYVPTQGSNCWDAPLPCASYFDESLRLRNESSLRWGFSSEGRAAELQRFW